jgi:hypothetical protein
LFAAEANRDWPVAALEVPGADWLTAAAAVRRWLAESSTKPRERALRRVIKSSPPRRPALCETATIGLVQFLWQSGRRGEAKELAASVLKELPVSPFLPRVARAIEIKESQSNPPPFVDQQLGADINHFAGKFCGRPFDDFELGPDGRIHICCPNHLPQAIGNANAGGTARTIINSDVARLVRKSILKQTFAYCDWNQCNVIQNGLLQNASDVTDPRHLQFIERGDGMIDGPRDLRLSHDPTCNLWCPSCRKEKIVAKGDQFNAIMEVTDRVVNPLMKTGRTVMMNGYGDIFSSRACRRILETVNETEHAGLQLTFITNGILFTADEWAKFPNIHGKVHSVRVSVDAATEATYAQVRLGGDFVKLKANLEFLSRLRQQNVIKEFAISFVVQRQNFREMEAFYRWGIELGCDLVIFECLMDWNTWTRSTYRANAVHLPDNPHYPEFIEFATKLRHAAKDTGRLSFDLALN